MIDHTGKEREMLVWEIEEPGEGVIRGVLSEEEAQARRDLNRFYKEVAGPL